MFRNVFVAAVLAVGIDIFRRNQLQEMFQWFYGGTSFDMIIAVMSAREHFDQRQAIRDTWWGEVVKNDTLRDRVQLKFVIGNSGCLVPPEDRLTAYSCDEWLPGPVMSGDVRAVDVNSNDDKIQGQHWDTTIFFRVQFPVVLSRLGVHCDCLKGPGRRHVILADALTETQIVAAAFDANDCKHDRSSGDAYVYQPIEPYLLPKAFEGAISMVWGDGYDDEEEEEKEETGGGGQRGKGPSCGAQAVSWTIPSLNNASGLIHFMQNRYVPGEDGNLPPKEAHPAVSFTFSVHDSDSLRRHLSGTLERQASWRETQARETQKLASESALWRDMLFVDVVDVYRHVPAKLLGAIHSLVSSKRFNFILKTDDDCLVDVDRVLSALESVKADMDPRGLTWWGSFRHSWAVERYGKWAETSYTAEVYPAFACGAGYVISRQVASWLDRNAESLYSFQGEDVSMGIWLAAIMPHNINTAEWRCEGECHSPLLALPQLRPEELRRMWRNKQHCGDPCGCPD